MPFISNVDVFYAIAEEAHAAMVEKINATHTQKPTGDGFVITFDPTLTSFKQACITIAFSAMYLEALTYFIALGSSGTTRADKVDRLRSYAEKLREIGICDSKLLECSERLRRARRELVHEKATEICPGFKRVPLKAQPEAENAIELIRAIRAYAVAP